MNSFYNSYNFFNLFHKIYNTDFNIITDIELDELKKLILENGSISIKFMQWYITNLINTSENNDNYKKIVTKFEDIFDNCPYHSKEETEEIFERNFNVSIYDIIQKDSLKRIASGSIGQVYRAILIDGREVAIKVKHPNISDLKENQMLFINLIIYLQKYSFFRNNFSLFMDIDDFIYNLNLQLDFRNEVFNTLKFTNLFYNNNKVIIPKVYYYSSEVIISEYCHGYYIHEITNPYIRKKIAINFLCFNLESAIFFNFMHADLHSRNWKVQENHKDSKIIIFDFGLCFTSISPEKNLKMWEAFQEVDLKKILEEKKYLIQGDSSVLSIAKVKELNLLKNESFEVNIFMKRLITIFKEHNLKVTKLFMNFIIWISLIEDMLRETGCFIRKHIDSDLTQHQRATIIAYCETSKCYNNILNYFKIKYNENTLNSIFNEEENTLIFSDSDSDSDSDNDC
tara:strand:- start:298 stop:1662 length:1365 start_codon:yes stop_codon:yes gene_type:complete